MWLVGDVGCCKEKIMWKNVEKRVILFLLFWWSGWCDGDTGDDDGIDWSDAGWSDGWNSWSGEFR